MNKLIETLQTVRKYTSIAKAFIEALETFVDNLTPLLGVANNEPKEPVKTSTDEN